MNKSRARGALVKTLGDDVALLVLVDLKDSLRVSPDLASEHFERKGLSVISPERTGMNMRPGFASWSTSACGICAGFSTTATERTAPRPLRQVTHLGRSRSDVDDVPVAAVLGVRVPAVSHGDLDVAGVESGGEAVGAEVGDGLVSKFGDVFDACTTYTDGQTTRKTGARGAITQDVGAGSGGRSRRRQRREDVMETRYEIAASATDIFGSQRASEKRRARLKMETDRGHGIPA